MSIDPEHSGQRPNDRDPFAPRSHADSALAEPIVRHPRALADTPMRGRGHHAAEVGSRHAPGRGRKLGWLFVVGLVLVGFVGVAAGFAAGAPGLVERAAERALGRVERRFGVRLEAREVDWTWSGHVRASDVVVRDDAGAVLATAAGLEVDSDVDVLARHVRVQRVAFERPVLKVTRDKAGHTNLDRLIAAARTSSEGGGGAVGGGVTIASELPLVVMDGATLALDAALPTLPLGLTLPGQSTFEGGRVTIRPTAPSPTGALADTPIKVEVAFATTSLDPGQGLSFAAEGPLAGPPARVEVRPARPVRFWLKERVVGVGGIALTADGVELGPLQLSVPITKGAAEVAAAASCERVILTPAPRELYARVAAALAGGATTEPADPAAGLTRARIKAALGALDEVKLVGPVVSLALGEGGHHDFEDLLPPLSTTLEPGLGGDGGSDLVRAFGDAHLAASERLLAPKPRGVDDADAPKAAAVPVKPLSARAAGLFEALAAQARRRVPMLARMLPPLPLKKVVIERGEILLSLFDAPWTVKGLAVEVTQTPPAGETASASTAVAATRTLHVAVDALETGPERPVMPSFVLDLSLAGEQVHAELTTKELPLDALAGAAHPADRKKEPPLVAPVGTLTSALTFDADVRGARWEASGKLAWRGGQVFHASLAHEPLTDIDVTFAGTVRWDEAEARLTVADGRVEARGVSADLSLDVADALRMPKLHLAAELHDTPAQRLFDALPKGFAPLLRGMRIEGTVRWPLTIDLDTASPEAIKIESHPTTRGLQVVSLGDVIDFEELRASHSYGILLADGTRGQRMVGPMTGAWVPLGAITPYLPLALTTTEDGTFYSNDGISTRAMLESIATNLQRGSFVRGASTLTQQLVKNLYLGGDKTISRKLQEVFIAWQMAQRLSKDEVMALYLNTIEFGPGIYGIGDAAWHWFGKRPLDLSLTEAIFLASIIPGPRKYYSFFLQGEVTPRWSSYLEALLKVMVERGKITEQELLAAAPYVPLMRGAGGGYSDSAPPEDFDEVPEGGLDRDEPDE